MLPVDLLFCVLFSPSTDLSERSAYSSLWFRTSPFLRKKTIPVAIPRLRLASQRLRHSPPRRTPTPSAVDSIYAPLVQMNRPSAKLCADCFPGTLRPSRSIRPAAPLRGVVHERFYATQRTGVSPAVSHRTRVSHLSAGPIAGSQLPLRSPRRARGLATASDAASQETGAEKKAYVPPEEGPLKEYDTRVQGGRLRDDPYQRGRQATILQCGHKCE